MTLIHLQGGFGREGGGDGRRSRGGAQVPVLSLSLRREQVRLSPHHTSWIPATCEDATAPLRPRDRPRSVCHALSLEINLVTAGHVSTPSASHWTRFLLPLLLYGSGAETGQGGTASLHRFQPNSAKITRTAFLLRFFWSYFDFGWLRELSPIHCFVLAGQATVQLITEIINDWPLVFLMRMRKI